jgi:hypothetical protein
MPWPFEDIFAGPTPADPPDEDFSLLDELERAVAVLAEQLRHEPGLSREAARLIVKQTAPAQSIFFRALIWPTARRVAGLPAQAKGGRRQKSAAESGRPQS